jgi:hypothetical protein
VSFHSLRQMHDLVADPTPVQNLWEHVIGCMADGSNVIYIVRVATEANITQPMSGISHSVASSIDGYRYESDYAHA